MASVNKVILIGHLGRDPETRFSGSGMPICNFTLATSKRRKDSEKTVWHRIVVFDKLAELCQQYLTKGRQVYVEGEINTEKYRDREGVERTSFEIVANQVVFMGGGEDRSGPPRERRQAPAKHPADQGFDEDAGGAEPYSPEDDDIPF